ncbi:DNA-binding protein [Candidatus Micrarchaeota archaeon]|nr:DNA-binding protein [Candidatus Micrarchaeota archaeon]
MKISEVKAGMNVSIEAEVIGIEAPREINREGRVLRVANALLRDDTGTISLVLWNENIDKIKEGDFIKIDDGFCKTWQDKLQITLGRNGKLTVLD